MVRHARSRRHVRCSKPATMITAGMHQRGATKSTLGSSIAVIIVIALLTAVSVGAQTPIPQLALWEANMRSYGQLACEYLGQPHSFDEYLTEVYYDAERAFQQVAEYAVDTTPLEETVSPWLSREVAYAIMSYINAEKVGAAPRARLPQLVDQALGHLDQWFVSRSFRCPSFCQPAEAAGQYYIQPFMLGLTAEALIMYADKTGDGRILPTIKTALDWLWDNAWVVADQSFWYENWVSDPSIPFPADRKSVV